MKNKAIIVRILVIMAVSVSFVAMYFFMNDSYQSLKVVNQEYEKNLTTIGSDLEEMRRELTITSDQKEKLEEDLEVALSQNDELISRLEAKEKENNTYMQSEKLSERFSTIVSDFADNWRNSFTEEEFNDYSGKVRGWHLAKVPSTGEYAKYYKKDNFIQIIGRTETGINTLKGIESLNKNTRVYDYDYFEFDGEKYISVKYLGVSYNYWFLDGKWYHSKNYLKSPFKMSVEHSILTEDENPEVLFRVFEFANLLRLNDSCYDVNMDINNAVFDELKKKSFGDGLYRFSISNSAITFGPSVLMYEIESIEEKEDYLEIRYITRMFYEGRIGEDDIVNHNADGNGYIKYYGDYIDWNGINLNEVLSNN